jgi:hypothetical protein
LLLLFGAACGERAVRSDLPALQFARADVLEAQRGAPELYARAEQARKLALAADDGTEQADHAQRARLWLAAALTEARRIDQARATSAAEARIAAAETQRVAAERERSELEETARRAEEGQHARDALIVAFELADRDALGGKAGDHKLDAARVQAAVVLEARAKLTRAAAAALGAQRGAESEAVSAARRAPRSSFERLADAKSSLEQAELALGEARAALPEPSAEERAALMELALVRGLAPRMNEQAVVFSLDRVFATGTALTPEGRRFLLAIADVLRAHPHGEVHLELLPYPSTPAGLRLGEARSSRITEALRSAMRPGRLFSTGPGSSRLVLSAYGAHAP